MKFELVSLATQFEQLVRELFIAESFQIEDGNAGLKTRPDIIVRSSSGARATVEIKLYRSKNLSTSLLRNALRYIENARREHEADRAILVVNGVVAPWTRLIFRDDFPNALIYDVRALAFLVKKHKHLIDLFEEITREAMTFSEAPETELQIEEVDIEADIRSPSSSLGEAAVPTEGETLCQEIKSVPSGRSNAKQFEEVATRALKYIFSDDLTAWSAQQSTDSAISYFDLVARVASRHDFWNMLANQFRSRYIIFEFKNYTQKIKQGQIYTTEKYLFSAALRSTAIVISRKGAHKNALAAARGAIRENGKLIINLDLEDLCNMLHRKDRGDDHNAVLIERVDEMLIKLER